MSWFRRVFYVSAALLLLFTGLWLVVANNQELSLDLLFFATPRANAGVVMLAAFAVGCGAGFLAGFNLFGLLKLNTRLYWLKREVRQLQEALGKRHER